MEKKKRLVVVALKIEESDKNEFTRICNERKSNKSEMARKVIKEFIHSTN